MPREEMLANIRAALGRAGRAPAPAPPVCLRASRIPREERIAVFFDCIQRLSGKTHRASSPSDACAYVAAVLEGRTSVASNAALLDECGITRLPRVTSGVYERPRLRELCASSDAGITGADFALADTGSLVMTSSPREARMISLLPPLHLAVVSEQSILSGLDELFETLPHPAGQSSSMVLITGPSRTADIEQILVRGVHGPGEIHVVVV